MRKLWFLGGLALLIGCIPLAREYMRLRRIAAPFGATWNPLRSSFSAFFEDQKRAAKSRLHAQLVGGAATADGPGADGALTGGGAGDGGSGGGGIGGAGGGGLSFHALVNLPSRFPYALPRDSSGTDDPEGADLPYPEDVPGAVDTESGVMIMRDVTVILNHWNRDTLEEQLDAIMGGSVLPKEVWVCVFSSDNAERYHSVVALKEPAFLARGMALHTVTSSYNFKFFGRFQMALQATTEYVWVIDDDVVPGRRFLELLTHTASVVPPDVGAGNAEGSSTTGPPSIPGDCCGALGSTGWLMPPPDKTTNALVNYRDPSTAGGLYLPDDRYGLAVTALVEVDLLCSQWFLETESVPLLFREHAPTHDTGEDMMLSYTLRKFSGLGSFILPVDEANPETWGNVQPASHTTLNKAPATSTDMVSVRNRVWASLTSRGVVPLRSQGGVEGVSVLMLLGSEAQAKQLEEVHRLLLQRGCVVYYLADPRVVGGERAGAPMLTENSASRLRGAATHREGRVWSRASATQQQCLRLLTAVGTKAGWQLCSHTHFGFFQVGGEVPGGGEDDSAGTAWLAPPRVPLRYADRVAEAAQTFQLVVEGMQPNAVVWAESTTTRDDPLVDALRVVARSEGPQQKLVVDAVIEAGALREKGGSGVGAGGKVRFLSLEPPPARRHRSK